MGNVESNQIEELESAQNQKTPNPDPPAYIPFKERVSYDERVKESARKLASHPYHVPVILEKQKNSELPTLDKSK